MAPKLDDDSEPMTTLAFRVPVADVTRLEVLARAIPALTKTAVARVALARGIEAFEAAMREPKEEARLAQLARLLGMGKPARG